jgi:hypothetical protein
LPVYTFAYTGISIPPSDPFPNGQTVYRPYLVVQIVAPSGQSLTCFVCLDTGADHCVFPLTFATALGLDPLQMKMQMTGGVGSVANATYYETITSRIPITDPNGNVTTVEFQTLAGFTAGMDAQGIGLLGQLGFFEAFPVTFNHKGKAFSIEV